MSKLAELKRQYEERWHYPPAMPTEQVKEISCGDVPFYHTGHRESKVYRACWAAPTSMPLQSRVGVCWEFPPAGQQRGSLPPPCRGSTIPTHLLEPTFEQCKNPYTRCDYQLEQCVHKQILVLEQKIKTLKRVLAKAKPLQIKKVKQMRYHGVRYRLLVSSTGCTKIYPEYLSRMAEERALCEFQRAYNDVNQSNTKLMKSFLNMREAMPELELRLSRLDRTLNSPFLAELDSVMENIEDMNTYFFGVVVKLKTWAELMDPMKEHSIEDYLALLSMDDNFKDFMNAGMENCTCKRCDKKDPLKPYLPCWCQHSEPCEVHTTGKDTDAGCYANKKSSDTSSN